MNKEGLENWINEILRMWNDSSAIGKIVLILASLGASTTLTSLSGIIVEWRGLIADMLYFYSQYVRDPIASGFRFITFGYLRLTGPVIDAMLLYLIYFSAEKRVIGNLRERSAVTSALFVIEVIVFPLVILSFILGTLFLMDRYLVSGVWTYADAITALFFLTIIFLSIVVKIHDLRWLSKGNCPESVTPESQPLYYRHHISAFISFVTPFVMSFLVLVLLASINSALF